MCCKASKEKKRTKDWMHSAPWQHYLFQWNVFTSKWLQVNSLWSCILLPRGEHSLPTVLPNPLALPSRSIPSQSFYMLTVWISLPPQERPEPLASQEPNSLTNSPQSSTDLSQSYTNVPLCHTLRQPNTCISQGAPFPSPALPPQIIRLSFLHTLA